MKRKNNSEKRFLRDEAAAALFSDRQSFLEPLKSALNLARPLRHTRAPLTWRDPCGMVDPHHATWRSEAQRSLSGALDVGLAFSSCFLVALTVVHHRSSVRRRRRDVTHATHTNRSDDSAYDDTGHDGCVADFVERVALVSSESSMELTDLGRGDDTSNKSVFFSSHFPASKALHLLDVTLFAAMSWGLMFAGHDYLCGVVMRCQCTFPWAGGWARCNAHNAFGGPRCPWCTAPYWTSVLTQKSCAVAMLAAYAVGVRGGVGAVRNEHDASDAFSCCSKCEDEAGGEWKMRGTRATGTPSAPSAPITGTPSRPSTPIVCFVTAALVSARTAVWTPLQNKNGLKAKSDTETDADALRRDAGGAKNADVGVLLKQVVTPIAAWFAAEMFWQLFFWLWLGVKQNPVYPCFVVCWDDQLNAVGTNPPSPLSASDAPPMTRLGRDLGLGR